LYWYREPNLSNSRIDALVNNAAVTGEYEGALAERISLTVLTNVTGPAITFEAFASLLSKSKKTPRVINVSSNVGSITLRLDPSYPYKDQKVVRALESPQM
jgi:NAD(P)-dependent dehydrogenase (short-subunit alcohol dehydrogenase family)